MYFNLATGKQIFQKSVVQDKFLITKSENLKIWPNHGTKKLAKLHPGQEQSIQKR